MRVLRSEIYENTLKFLRIGNRAVRRAQEESRDMGVANVYSHTDGTLYWQLPDGTITYEDPYLKEEPKLKDG